MRRFILLLAAMYAAYFFATEATLGTDVGTSVFAGINNDQGHLLGVLIPGALMAIVGQILQAVGLLRSRAVPRWVPIASMFALLTVVVPGNGVVGLVTSLPMTAAAVAIAYFAYRRTGGSVAAWARHSTSPVWGVPA